MHVPSPPSPPASPKEHVSPLAGVCRPTCDLARLGGSDWLGMAAEASDEVVAANGRALGVVRALLASEAAASVGLGCLLAHFQRLVAADGPLPFVRFAAPAFEAARRAAAACASPGEAPRPDVCLAMLAPAASPGLRASLQAFVAQPFVPPDDRLAAVAALATWALETPVPLALYAIFEAQLADA